MTVDFFLVALVVNRSLEMFRSLVGTWLPCSLIFLSTFITGVAGRHRRGADWQTLDGGRAGG